MIKKVIIELLTIILIILLMTEAVYAAVTLIETDTAKDVVDSINTDADNPLKDQDVVQIQNQVEEETEKQFQLVIPSVEAYIEEKFTAKGPEFYSILELYDYDEDKIQNGDELKIGIVNEIKKESKSKWQKKAEEYWNEHKDEIKERITNEAKKQGTLLIENYSKVVVQTMFDPIYDEIEAQINDSIPILGTVCANLANRYVNSFKIDTLIANEIKKEVGLEVKKYEIKKFDWGEEAIRAGFSAVGSEASKYAEDLLDEATAKVLDKLGIDTSETDLDEAITDWLGIQVEDTVQQWTKNAIDYVLNTSDYDELVKKMTQQSIEKFGEELTEKMKDDIAEKAKEAINKQKSEAEKRLSEMKDEALEKIAESAADLAADYAMDLYENLEDEIDKFSKQFGKFGSSVIRGLSNQLKTWIGGNITTNVSAYLKNAFLDRNEKVDWTKFEIDWTRLGANVLLNILFDDSLAEKLDLAYGMISSVGGLVSGPVPFETYSKLYFMFALRIPSLTTATTSATAGSAASSGISDEGNLGVASDVYDPNQFNPLADNTLITATGAVSALQYATVHLKSVGAPVPVIIEPTARTITKFVPLWTAVFTPRCSIMGRYCIYIM